MVDLFEGLYAAASGLMCNLLGLLGCEMRLGELPSSL